MAEKNRFASLPGRQTSQSDLDSRYLNWLGRLKLAGLGWLQRK